MPKRWDQLRELLRDIPQLQIFLHDDPDPDAVASGVALRFLVREVAGVGAEISYRGVIGRAENKALVDYVGIPMERLPEEEVELEGPVALIDTQPGAGNSPVPAGYHSVLAVIDHHGQREGDRASFVDVRPWIGASSTILTQYLRAADVKPPTRVATALFYGIKTDTKALSRDTSAADVAAYFYLLPFVDVDAMVEIENAQVPPAYFRNLAKAMEAAGVYEGAVISFLGTVDYPDLAAEIADLFLRLEGVEWVVCSGVYDGEIYLSVRARSEDANADEMAQALIGDIGSAGGRNTLAGGQVNLDGKDPERVAEQIRQRALDYLDIPADTVGQPLV